MNKTNKIIKDFMKKNKIYLTIGIIVVVLIIIIVIFSSLKPKGENIIKIGFMTDLSGPASAYGEEIQKGAQLALDKINGKENNFDLRVIFEDDRCSSSTGTTIINKLINIDKVKITGGTVCSSVAMSIAPIVERNKIIHLVTGASSPELSNAGDYIFRIWPSDDFEARVLADYATKDLGLKSVSILYVNSEFGNPLKDAFSNSFKNNGGEIITVETYNTSEKDFKTQLSKIALNEPEAVYIITNPPELPIILKQIKELNIESTILSYGPVIEAKGVLESAKDNINGLYYAHPNQIDSDWFVEKYEFSYSIKPGLGASVGYDTLMLLYMAIDSCQSDNTNCIKDYLYSVQSYKGASGRISFDENGDVFIPFLIKQIENNKPVIIKK